MTMVDISSKLSYLLNHISNNTCNKIFEFNKQEVD